MTPVPNETEQALNRLYDVCAAAHEEYRKKISDQAARIEQLEAALRGLIGAVADHTSQKSIPQALIEARAALEGK